MDKILGLNYLMPIWGRVKNTEVQLSWSRLSCLKSQPVCLDPKRCTCLPLSSHRYADFSAEGAIMINKSDPCIVQDLTLPHYCAWSFHTHPDPIPTVSHLDIHPSSPRICHLLQACRLLQTSRAPGRSHCSRTVCKKLQNQSAIIARLPQQEVHLSVQRNAYHILAV